jgi:hypothetical protein
MLVDVTYLEWYNGQEKTPLVLSRVPLDWLETVRVRP